MVWYINRLQSLPPCRYVEAQAPLTPLVDPHPGLLEVSNVALVFHLLCLQYHFDL